MKCTFYIDAVGGIVVCSDNAPYMHKGSSYCDEHIKRAVVGNTWEMTPDRAEQLWEEMRA